MSEVLVAKKRKPRLGSQKRKVDLSPREVDVLQLVAHGYTNSEVGRQLFIAEETVKTHMLHVLEKLGARTRAHAVAIGIRRGKIV